MTRRNGTLRISALLLASLVMLGMGQLAAVADDSGAPGLSPAEELLLESEQPVRVTVDQSSGAPTSVELLSDEEVAALEQPDAQSRSVKTGCTGVVGGCWYGVALPQGPPSSNLGFNGTTTGTWINRGNFWVSAGQKASVCWNSSCTDRLYGPSVLIEFGGTVTGKKVTLALVT